MLSRCRSSSSTTSTRRRALAARTSLRAAERLDQLLALDRLQRVADGAALERLLRVVGDRDHVHRDVARLRVALELIEHAEAGVVGQVDVEQDRARPVARAPRQASLRCARHALEAQLVRQVAQDGGEGHVVFDDQDARAVAASAGRARGRRRLSGAGNAGRIGAARAAPVKAAAGVGATGRAPRAGAPPAAAARIASGRSA
jgi:hypothetical protein